MWRYLTTLALLSPLAQADAVTPPPAAVGTAAPSPSTATPLPAMTEVEWEQHVLAEACATFRGEASLSIIREQLKNGVDPNLRSMGDETPLLLLCHALELDYRYRSEPSYRAAVKEAITLLLQHGADPLLENELGCNAVFYIEGKPELAKKLAEAELLPRELSLRIPSGGAALTRYIRKRAAQAKLTRHEGSQAYLSRRYCAPAYDRVFERLQRYLRAESSAHLPPSALRDCLAFLRVADRKRIEEWVNQNPLWEHSEHFLEEIPERFLAALCELDWAVEPSRLTAALSKLDTMLPKTKDDMIECFAGIPMSQLLAMLNTVDPAAAEPLLNDYATSRDSTLAGEALCLLLERQGLPRPEPRELEKRLAPLGADGALSPEQQNLFELSLVDAAAGSADWTGVDAATARRVQAELRRMNLAHHADLLSLLIENNSITSDADALAEVRSAWSDPAVPSPQALMARTLLQHPEYCRPLPGPEAGMLPPVSPASPVLPSPETP